VDSRYTLQKYLGSGSYGVVVSATTPDETPVAIKKIGNVFKNSTTAKRTVREVLLMMHLRHDNVIGIADLTAAEAVDGTGATDLYVVTEVMDTDLHKVIRSPQPLSDQHCQYFLYQTLRGLKYVHSANVLHRDLKPSNLLVNENCDLKITDFGLSRAVGPAHSAAEADYLTEYVVTRWYRAPEVVLSSGAYSKAIDVWSAGCIFGELLNRKPLFPGQDHVSQLTCILDLLGTPSPEECAHLPDKARRYVLALPQRAPKPLAEVLPNATPLALDLLQGMLCFDPARRISVEEALAHPYLQTFHNPALEPVADEVFNFELERQEPAELLWAALCQFRPQLATEPPPVRRPAGAPAEAGTPPADCKSYNSRPRYKPPSTASTVGRPAGGAAPRSGPQPAAPTETA